MHILYHARYVFVPNISSTNSSDWWVWRVCGFSSGCECHTRMYCYYRYQTKVCVYTRFLNHDFLIKLLIQPPVLNMQVSPPLLLLQYPLELFLCLWSLQLFWLHYCSGGKVGTTWIVTNVAMKDLYVNVLQFQKNASQDHLETYRVVTVENWGYLRVYGLIMLVKIFYYHTYISSRLNNYN